MKAKLVRAAAVVLYGLAFHAFYLKYVPLIPGFQAIFLPVGLLVALAAAWNLRAGAIAFLAAFPLVNNWPYFFGVQQSTPHAPTALVLALFFFFGVFLRAFLLSLRIGSRREIAPLLDGSAFDKKESKAAPKGALMPPVAEGGPSRSATGGNRRDWFHGVGGRRTTFGEASSLLSKISKPSGGDAIIGPMRVTALLIAVSAVLTTWKWTHFVPLRADGVYDFATNVNGVSAGGARMSTAFAALSYLVGFALFVVFRPLFRDERMRRTAATTLGASLLAAVLFGLVQHFAAPGLGNTEFWKTLSQINGTFKDPNSFGTVLAGLIPFFLGGAFFFGGVRRVLCLSSFALSAAVFPFIGARSALLGMIGALFLFAFFALREAGPRFRKVRWPAIAAIAVAVVGIAVVFSQSRLYERMAGSVRGLSSPGGLVNLSPERYFLWKEAVRMTADYPFSGVGVGAFIVDLPDYYAKDKAKYLAGFEGWRRNDSAENYFLQASAELGLPGLAAVLALFWAVFRAVKRALRGRKDLGRERYLLYGASAGLTAIGLNMLFHSYIGSFETQFTFWILAAFAAAIGPAAASTRAELGKKPKIGRILVVVGVILYAGVVLWNQWHSLSLADRTERYGLSQQFGLYPPEKTEDGRVFNWTRKDAGLTLKVGGPVLRIPLLATHPDIAQNPVRVEIVLVRDMFRTRETVREVLLTESAWMDVDARVSEFVGQDVLILVKASRTWNPNRDTGVPDPRNLGVAIGEITFPPSLR